MKSEKEEYDRFTAHLNRCSEEVDKWPEEKKRVFRQIMGLPEDIRGMALSKELFSDGKQGTFGDLLGTSDL